QTIDTFVHNGRGVFGSDSGSCSFVLRNRSIPKFQSTFHRLYDTKGEVNSNDVLEGRFSTSKQFFACGQDLEAIPGSPIAYWANHKTIMAFRGPSLSSIAESGGRCKTHNDERYLRMPWEIACDTIGINRRWRFYDNGGKLRKYYGNRFTVIDWSTAARDAYKSVGGLSNQKYWSRLGITWTDIKWATNGFRIKPEDSEYNSLSPCL